MKPWIAPPREGESGKDATKRVSKILTILNNADIHQIQDTCAQQQFTHVHILAHGAEDPRAEGRPFGLALRAQDGSDNVDVVSGSRIATALRSLCSASDAPAYPSVVTVASCDSGNRGNVVYSGASFAHELHQAGIPFVVASQFPLSKPGSVHMVEVLYDRLLWGEDPREVLHDLRRKLYALRTSTTHDWASLVVYCALPATLGDQLKDTAYGQAKAAINTALEACDDLIAELTGGTTTLGRDQLHHHVDELLRRADAAAERMPTGGEYETEGFGMLASTEKRKAEVQYQLGRALLPATESTETVARVFEASLASLRRAQAHYETAVQQNMAESSGAIKKKRSLHWVLTQHLSLRMVLGEPLLEDYWMAAKVSAEVDRNWIAARHESVQKAVSSNSMRCWWPIPSPASCRPAGQKERRWRVAEPCWIWPHRGRSSCTRRGGRFDATSIGGAMWSSRNRSANPEPLHRSLATVHEAT